MGYFIVEPESDKEEREHRNELKQIAQDTLELTKNAPENVFPDFLWEIQMNEFEHEIDYKTRAACKNPWVLRAYSIGRKYQDYWRYIEAMNAYVEYADYIDKIYGSFDMLRKAAKDGYSTVFIPPLPKLTHKKKNKLFIESGFIPSRVDEEFEPDDEGIEESIESLPDGIIIDDPNTKLSKEEMAMRERVIANKERADRIAGIYTGSNGTSMDAVIRFMTGASLESSTVIDRSNGSVSEAIEDLHEDDFIPSEILEDRYKGDTKAIENGMIVRTKDRELMSIIKTLEENGFSFLDKSATVGMKTEAVRVLRQQLGATEVDLDSLSKKERKKLKKKMKRDEFKRTQSVISDRRMQRTLLSNRIRLDVADSVGGSGINPAFANFRLSDVFGEDDE